MEDAEKTRDEDERKKCLDSRRVLAEQAGLEKTLQFLGLLRVSAPPR
jgi:hypothetical protein